MSARRSAGASLTPSPVIATVWPSARSASTRCSLVSGLLRATISSRRLAQQPVELRLGHRIISAPVRTVGSPLTIPTSRAIAVAVRPWSPVTTMIRMPGPPAARDRIGDLRTRRVLESDQADEAEPGLGVLAIVGRLAQRDARRSRAPAALRRRSVRRPLAPPRCRRR